VNLLKGEIMPLSLSEEVAEIYFRRKGYFVTRNLSYLVKRQGKKQAGNLDIDVLAVKGKEAVVVSCKRGSLRTKQEEGELERFKLAVDYITGDSLWKSAMDGCFIEKMYVAEHVTRHNREFFENHGIKVIELKEMVHKLIELLRDEMINQEQKMLDGAETKVLPKILKFMIKHDLIKTEREKL